MCRWSSKERSTEESAENASWLRWVLAISYCYRKMVEEIRGKKIRTCMEEAMDIAFESSQKITMSIYTLIIHGIQFLTCLTNRDKMFSSKLRIC